MIPTYNRPAFLKEALESCLMQDYPNLEVIISDNASALNVQELVRPYLSDRRLRYYRNEKNIGILPNWKKLFYEYPTGEYGKLLADDDYILNKSHITEAVELLTREKLDIVFSSATIRIDLPGGGAKYRKAELDVPEVVPRDWWIANIGRRKGSLRGFAVFPNLVSGSVFNLAKVRELKAFLSPDFALDYELALKFMLLGRTGYLRGDQYVERSHAQNDGVTVPFEEAWQGMYMFERISRAVERANIDPHKMSGLRTRSVSWFVNSFILGKWFNENGMTIRSINSLFNKISSIDRRAAIRSMFSLRMLKLLVKKLLKRA
jgi:glycosyltransferase involved in cell wall biosynthesis